MSEIKSVEQPMPAPFEHIRVDVRPWSWANKPGVQGHTVGVMNMDQGKGTRGSLEYAEAEAKAVLKAIRAYRRKNAAHLSSDPS